MFNELKQKFNNKPNRLVQVLFGLIIVFVIMQLYILTNVGTKGELVSNVRNRQAELKIENEIKRARILELQSNNAVLDTAQNLQMSPTSVQYIDSDVLEIAAQQ